MNKIKTYEFFEAKSYEPVLHNKFIFVSRINDNLHVDTYSELDGDWVFSEVRNKKNQLHSEGFKEVKLESLKGI
jgi:hypothetical protein|tara:strand:- start:206 stop:427 length:222 start_codon:yes stop_codon:yes gene_type:complete